VAKLKSAQDISMMREAGRLAALTLKHVEPLIKPGVSTEEINKCVHDFIVSHGAHPTPLNYRGYPKSVCTSINEVICHGIPCKEHILKDGDIINVDVTVTLNEWLGDTSKTYFVGTNTPKDRIHVTEVAFESLARGMAAVSHGGRMGDIGAAIQQYAEAEGCGVVRDFVGHGIGKIFHEPDVVVTHYGKKGTGMRLARGMTFTIEPMINGGSWQHRMLRDQWTAVTTDGKPSAQFEHTLAIVGDGIEVLTALPGDEIVTRARELGAKILWPELS
jgi:methionyl aminopeptidase